MENFATDPLEPHLLKASLFALNLPGNIKNKDIRHIFKDFDVLRIQIIGAKEVNGGNWRPRRTREGERKGKMKVAQIEFSSIALGGSPRTQHCEPCWLKILL